MVIYHAISRAREVEALTLSMFAQDAVNTYVEESNAISVQLSVKSIWARTAVKREVEARATAVKKKRILNVLGEKG